jgi:S1-C subfamily serine protease
MREESNRRPLYTPSREGVRILQVKPGSSGERGGLRERDIIIEVNGSKVDNFEQVRELLKISPRSRLQIKRCGQLITIRLVGDDPGIIPVPQGPVARYLTWMKIGYLP